MTLPNPQQPSLKAVGDLDYNALLRFFATKAMRASRTSPPLAKDVEELTWVYDKTLNRLYTKSDGTLRYIAFT